MNKNEANIDTLPEPVDSALGQLTAGTPKYSVFQLQKRCRRMVKRSNGAEIKLQQLGLKIDNLDRRAAILSGDLKELPASELAKAAAIQNNLRVFAQLRARFVQHRSRIEAYIRSCNVVLGAAKYHLGNHNVPMADEPAPAPVRDVNWRVNARKARQADFNAWMEKGE